MRRQMLLVVAILVALVAAVLLARNDSDEGVRRPPIATPTTSTAPLRTDIKGESASGTVEPRLLRDPDVLWVGTWETTDWPTKHGVGPFRDAENTTIGDFRIGGAGRSLQAKTSAWRRQGFSYQANFERAGIGAHEDVHYRYRVFFPNEYVWQNDSGRGGGKLPGLAGKAPGGDEEKVGDGGKRWGGSSEISRDRIEDMDGFSARMLWHEDGGLSSYLYIPDAKHLGQRSPKSYFGWSTRCRTDPTDSDSPTLLFKKGAWNTVEQHVRLNTPGVANGVLEVWMNGKLCIKLTNLIYRSAKHPEVKITQQYVTWFYGGPTSDYPTRDSYVYFDDAVLSKSYIGRRTS
jgi:hypothetical protein